MLSIFKRKIIEPITFKWNGKNYNLDYPLIRFNAEYNKLTTIFKSWLINEVELLDLKLASKENELFWYLGQLNINYLPMVYSSFEAAMKGTDNQFVNSYSRFLDVVAFIHISCDTRFLELLYARFYKTHTDMPYYSIVNKEVAKKEHWELVDKEYKWVWLLPHYQLVFQANRDLYTIVSIGSYSPPQ